MALKDWKKNVRLSDRKMTVYEKGKINIAIIKLFKKYSVVSSKGPRSRFIRHFKSKSQALKFAKSYMRRH